MWLEGAAIEYVAAIEYATLSTYREWAMNV